MNPTSRRKLGVLLASGRTDGPLVRARAACEKALDEQVGAFLYLLHDGTAHVRDPMLQSLRERGLRLYCCAFNARGRGIETDDSAIYCGLGILADMLVSVDQFLSFTGSRWDGSGAGGDVAASNGERRTVRVSVCSDPGVSDMAAEGVRVALGLLSSGRLGVELVFGGPGLKCVRPGIEKTPEGAALVTHLENFRERGGQVRVGEDEALTDAGRAGCFAILGF